MGGICSLCLKNNRDTDDEEIDLAEFNDGDKDDEKYNAAASEGRASEAIYVLDPQTFEFIDALHLPKDSKKSIRNPSRGFLEVPLLRRVSKRNSLTSWLAGGLFSPKGSKNESFGVSTSPPSYVSSSFSSRDKTSLRPIKMLMSGAGESGKSTVVKQMQIIHQGGFSTEELNDFRMHIYRNIQESMLQILEVMDSNELCRDERTLEAVWQIRRFKPNYEELECLPEDYVAAINFLWIELIRNSFDLILRKSYILDSAPYLLDDINRISAMNYVPTNDDVLRARVMTTGISEFNFKSGPLAIKMIDVGGQRSERRIWIETFDNVTTLIFCVALSEYDLMLREEPRQNRLLESFQLWESVINSKWFQRSSVVLFLNKCDIFRQKLRSNSISKYFSDYKLPESVSEEVNYENAAEFLKNKFLAMNYGRLQIYPYLTCATDTKNIDIVFAAVKETILANNLRSAGIL